MRHSPRLVLPAIALPLALSLALADAAVAQRRGRPEMITKRLGNYFVSVTLPQPDEGQSGAERLASSKLVQKAAEQGHLSLLYLFDPQGDERKHKLFETTLFSNDSITISLLCFQCGRVDLSTDIASMAEYGKKAPLFVAFDAEGKPVGEVSMSGYKVASAPLTMLLGRAARGHTKPQIKSFAKKYRALLNDLQVLDGRKNILRAQRRRADEGGDKKKLKELDKDDERLAAEEQKLLESEKELLADAKVPPRDKDAEPVGGPRRDR